MLRIRLSRVGKRKQPSFRLVVADSHAPRDGAFIKIIGHYNPRTDPTTLVVKEDEAEEWLRRGAQPSETAAKLLTRIGVMERAGLAPVTWDRKTPVKPKKAEEEAPVAAPAAKAEAKAEAPAEDAKAEAKAEPEEAEATAEAPEDEAPAEDVNAEAEAAAEAPAEDANAEAEAEAKSEGESSEDTKATE
ncbi:MAG: 30S ribosomal protein S16 [Chloroflexi bacterium RBG_16_64_32]|nr:MAG: 30S ribosomal protein S16 [Chloroflexi bacterium RBG_16_64_32]